MSDKTTALLAVGNAMATRLRKIEFSRYSDEWDAAILDIRSDAELAYLIGLMEGRQENFAGHLKALIEKDPKSVVASDASYAYGFLEACDKTFEIRDLARDSILRYDELLLIAWDLAAAISLPRSNVRATDIIARLRALDEKPKKAPPPPSPNTQPPLGGSNDT